MMYRDYYFITPQPPFRLDLTVWTLRRRADNTVDRWDDHTYRRVLDLPGGPVEVAVRQTGSVRQPKLRVAVFGRKLDSQMKARVSLLLQRLLGLDLDLRWFYDLAREYPLLNQLAGDFRGMRPPRFATAFEAVINAIACQQLTLTVGIRFLNRLSAAFGKKVDSPTAGRAFPGAEDLAAAPLSQLREMGFSGNKSRAIIEVAGRVACGELDLESLATQPDEAALAQLQSLRGVGRWTAEYVLLRSLGRVHIFPADDVGARNNLQRWLNIAEPLDYQGVHRALGPWRSFGGLIYFHLLLRSLMEAGHI